MTQCSKRYLSSKSRAQSCAQGSGPDDGCIPEHDVQSHTDAPSHVSGPRKIWGSGKANRREVVSKSDPLDRPATPEEIQMVERLLKPTRPAENVVPLPKARPVPKSSTEVLALPVMPLLSPMRRGPSHFDLSHSSGPGAVVLQFVDPTKPDWLRPSDRRLAGSVREGDQPEKPPGSR